MLLATSLAMPSAMAATESVPLKTLGVSDTIYLPTVRAQREIIFTKPKTWNVGASSHVDVVFQHSHQLLPNRSWLEVIVNNMAVKRIPLTHENASATKVSVPIPVWSLKDFNSLKFRVEQHYTDRCEDPTDPSLWTQILPSSQLVLDYALNPPEMNLAQYPYPVIDDLAYRLPRLQYVLPKSPSLGALEAVSLVQAHLAQRAGRQKKLQAAVSLGGGQLAPDAHWIVIGTPSQLPTLLKDGILEGTLSLQQGRWVNTKTQQPVADRDGVVVYWFRQDAPYAMVVVSGNTEQGMLQAAKFITKKPLEAAMKGKTLVVPGDWHADSTQQRHVPRFIENQDRTFAELGYKTEEVFKINAPPMVYNVPVVSDFSDPNGAQLWLDLVYSYGHTEGEGPNPRFSSLEVRFNDRAIYQVSLLNKDHGEALKKVSFRIPPELIQTHNTLVAQFHLLPDKYGHCVDTYIDTNWGKIHDDSKFRVQGNPKSLLPDAGLLNETGFPYSRAGNLAETHLAFPQHPSARTLEAMLAVLGRIGRQTQSDTDLRFTVGWAGEGLPSDKDVLAFEQHPGQSGPFLLQWVHPLLKQLKLSNGQTVQLSDNGLAAFIEQQSQGMSRVLTRITTEKPQVFSLVSNLFNQDNAFYALTSGNLQAVREATHPVRAVQSTLSKKPAEGKSGSWWDTLIGWLSSLWNFFSLQNLLWIVGALVGLILLRVLFRRR